MIIFIIQQIYKFLESRKVEVLTNWSLSIWAPNIYNALQIFKSYFIRQWLAGTFVNWQIFNTPAGYSTTQNPEEWFNNQIKLIFTEFERLSVLGACNAMHKICVYYSEYKAALKLFKDKCNKVINQAKECSKTDFTQTDNNTLWYKNKYQIFLEPRYCSCEYFIDDGTCKHHVAACIISGHLDFNDRQFTFIKSRGRPKKTAKGLLP